MTDYELHGDFDHTGRRGWADVAPRERARRRQAPGLIVVANLDSDKTTLASKVTATAKPTPNDAASPRKSSGDDEPAPLRLRIKPPALPAGTELRLRVTGPVAEQIALYTSSGRKLDAEGPAIFKVPPDSRGVIDLRVEAATIGGTPAIESPDPGHTANVFGETGQFTLELFDSSKRDVVLESAYGTVAPLYVPSNDTPPRLLFIVETPDNTPAVEDVKKVVVPGMTLIVIPQDVARNDGWIQDQFQHAVARGPAGWMDVVIHLPRARENFVQTSTPGQNLSGFVQTFFVSKDLGVFDDFWTKRFTIVDADGRSRDIEFGPSFELLTSLQRVFRFTGELQRAAAEVKQFLMPPGDWSDARALMDTKTDDIVKALRDAAGKATEEKRAATLNDWAAGLESWKKSLAKDFRRAAADIPKRDRIELTIPDQTSYGTQAAVLAFELDKLFTKLDDAHQSLNYGGNVEATPAVDGAPLGKLLVGTAEQMYAPLRTFLEAQIQPVVSIDTSWLDVKHVDEIVTFVHAPMRGRFVALRASPAVALSLLREADQLFRRGLLTPRDGPIEPETGGRFNTDGKNPMTHLLRGKTWLHEHEVQGSPLEPPLIYRRLARANPVFGTSEYVPYEFGPGDPRQYFANLSAREVLQLERDRNGQSVNDFIETTFLKTVDAILAKELGDPAIYPLPVLFDAIDDLKSWDKDHRDETTTAFTPDLANLQVLGKTLLVPRPFGPRMRPADAVTVVRAALQSAGLGSLDSGLSEDWLRTRKLGRLEIWLRPEQKAYKQRTLRQTIGVDDTLFPGISTLDDVVTMFQDGFPKEKKSDIAKKIEKENPGAFTGLAKELRKGWRRLVIPEKTVDVFEAYTQFVIERLGLTVQWVDAWFYHQRRGEIHCGTNVIRTPDKARDRKWWDLQRGATK